MELIKTMYGYIYMTTNLINGRRYIGQKKSDVFLAEKYLGSGIALENAIKKYGKDCWKVELIDDTATSKEHLDKLEMYYISKYTAVKDDKFYNIAIGGQGGALFKGHKHSEATRRLMSQQHSGEHNNNYGNHKTRWSDAVKRQHSDRMSGKGNSMYGKHHSEETKQKLRNIQLGYKIVLNDEHNVKCHVENLEIFLRNGYRNSRDNTKPFVSESEILPKLV